MRTFAPLAVLLSALAACSSNDNSPTGLKPEFTENCQPPRLAVSNPPAVTKPRNTSSSTKFIVSNGCSVPLGGWTASTSRTGAVVSVGAPSIVNLPTLAPGASVAVFVGYTTGSSAGTGTVVLTVTNDLGTVSRSGSLTVTVSP